LKKWGGIYEADEGGLAIRGVGLRSFDKSTSVIIISYSIILIVVRYTGERCVKRGVLSMSTDSKARR